MIERYDILPKLSIKSNRIMLCVTQHDINDQRLVAKKFYLFGIQEQKIKRQVFDNIKSTKYNIQIIYNKKLPYAKKEYNILCSTEFVMISVNVACT